MEKELHIKASAPQQVQSCKEHSLQTTDMEQLS